MIVRILQKVATDKYNGSFRYFHFVLVIYSIRTCRIGREVRGAFYETELGSSKVLNLVYPNFNEDRDDQTKDLVILESLDRSFGTKNL